MHYVATTYMGRNRSRASTALLAPPVDPTNKD